MSINVPTTQESAGAANIEIGLPPCYNLCRTYTTATTFIITVSENVAEQSFGLKWTGLAIIAIFNALVGFLTNL